MLEWIQTNDTLLWWFAASSLLVFISGLLIVPALIIRIPADYFSHTTRHRLPWSEYHPVIRTALLLLKNILGLILLLTGIVMLVFPGPGIFTIIIGLTLINFPGKYRFERWLVSRPPVLRSINWLRLRSGHPPLVID
ncbi:MAG: hypothetical protein OQK13_02990 [Gammaproteobacteria bacterium]|nr:hypothetical protein [Gammaproteobacteria bacterium]